MKRAITKQEQSRINDLLNKRREKEIEKALTISQSKERISMYEEQNYLRQDGYTHIESQQLENLFLKK